MRAHHQLPLDAVATVLPPTCYPATRAPTGPAGPPGMPATGNSSGRLLPIGLAALGSGVVLLLAGTLLWRRRRP